jgi:hypothetical protein
VVVGENCHYAAHDECRWTICVPSISSSIRIPKKQWIATWVRQTTGSFSLNLVSRTTGRTDGSRMAAGSAGVVEQEIAVADHAALVGGSGVGEDGEARHLPRRSRRRAKAWPKSVRRS